VHLSEALYQEVVPEAPLSHRSITIHHLRPLDLAEAPSMGEVLEPLRTALEGRYLLAWAAEIEASFLARTFGGRVRRWLARTIDVLPLAVLADRLEGRDSAQDYSLSAVVARAGLPSQEAHDALNDALMTAEVFLVVAARLARFGLEDVRTLSHPDRIKVRGIALPRIRDSLG